MKKILKGVKMNKKEDIAKNITNKLQAYTKIEEVQNQVFNTFNEHSCVPIKFIDCKHCPYSNNGDYTSCWLNTILISFNIISYTELCYYNFILNLVDKYYLDFGDTIRNIVNDFIGCNITNVNKIYLKTTLKQTLMEKYIDDMFCDIEERGSHWEIKTIFRFKDDIIYQIINNVYKDCNAKFMKKGGINDFYY